MAIPRAGSQFHKIVPRLLNAGKYRVLTGTFLVIALIAFIDWRVGNNLSLGGFYILPMLLAATVLPPNAIVALAFSCALLRVSFGDSRLPVQYGLHFVFSSVTYMFSGLFVVAVIRNREMALQHLAQITREQRLRNEAQERLRILVESSPAAILTLDEQGTVLAANRAADMLFGLEADFKMEGRSIKPYMPVLSEVLRLGARSKLFHTAAEAQGRKENGELFLADLWFSTYVSREGTQLAAIVVDASEEMRDREQQNVRNLSTSSRLVVAAVLHEIRNLCSAISVVYSNLKERDSPCRVEDIQGLETLVRGLSRVASLELYGREHEVLEDIPLQQLLDELSIIIEPNWQEIGGTISWTVPEATVRVLADRYGLMQVFLNLAQNSHRAVQAGSARKLAIQVAVSGKRAMITFGDTGCGIADPRHLFQPFQQGADVTGLGLFISRALVRSYGGELRFQPQAEGCSFTVELPVTSVRRANA